MLNEPTENSEKKQIKGRFVKGQSGNPQGKPKGTRHKATQAALVLLDGEAEALTRKAVEMALDGDIQALRLCLERLIPPCKDKPLPELNFLDPITSGDISAFADNILIATTNGELSVKDAEGLLNIAQQCQELSPYKRTSLTKEQLEAAYNASKE